MSDELRDIRKAAIVEGVSVAYNRSDLAITGSKAAPGFMKPEDAEQNIQWNCGCDGRTVGGMKHELLQPPSV